MQIWFSFVVIPFLMWIIFSAILFISKYLYPEVTTVSKFLEVFIFLGYAALPYIMLGLAPIYRYRMTLIYMMAIVLMTSFVHANFMIDHIHLTYIYLALSWTLISITIYYFYSDHK